MPCSEPVPGGGAAQPVHPALTSRFTEPGSDDPAGALELTGRLLSASNATFAAELTRADGTRISCVYKPVAGERPLWDFGERELARREVAAYQLSSLGGFDLVPYTAWVDGPAGQGSLQVWVDTDDDDTVVDLVPSRKVHERPDGLVDYAGRRWHSVLDGLDGSDREVTLLHAEDDRLRRMALFDAVINNADRKGGHVLEMPGGHRHGVDHGVTFHTDERLRTVLWGWVGAPVTEQERDGVTRVRDGVAGDLGAALAPHLADEEIDALAARCERLLAEGVLPPPRGDMPAVPWPPF